MKLIELFFKYVKQSHMKERVGNKGTVILGKSPNNAASLFKNSMSVLIIVYSHL